MIGSVLQGENLLDFPRFHVDRRRSIVDDDALTVAGAHDERDAARPSRQHVGERQEFEDERRQQQRMEADET